MWARIPTANNLASVTMTGLTVNGQVNVNGPEVIKGSFLYIDSSVDPGIQFFDTTQTTTRTTYGLQVQPRFANTWFTPTSGPLQMTFAEYPGGFVHWTGIASNATASNRGDGIYAFDLVATTFAQRFIPLTEVHCLADGADRANNQQPVFVLGTDGTIRCYNLDNTTASQVDYRMNCVYNKFSTPGKYENTGGGPT